MTYLLKTSEHHLIRAEETQLLKLPPTGELILT